MKYQWFYIPALCTELQHVGEPIRRMWVEYNCSRFQVETKSCKVGWWVQVGGAVGSNCFALFPCFKAQFLKTDCVHIYVDWTLWYLHRVDRVICFVVKKRHGHLSPYSLGPLTLMCMKCNVKTYKCCKLIHKLNDCKSICVDLLPLFACVAIMGSNVLFQLSKHACDSSQCLLYHL